MLLSDLRIIKFSSDPTDELQKVKCWLLFLLLNENGLICTLHCFSFQVLFINGLFQASFSFISVYSSKLKLVKNVLWCRKYLALEAAAPPTKPSLFFKWISFQTQVHLPLQKLQPCSSVGREYFKRSRELVKLYRGFDSWLWHRS